MCVMYFLFCLVVLWHFDLGLLPIARPLRKQNETALTISAQQNVDCIHDKG